jgi:hypothetical protein
MGLIPMRLAEALFEKIHFEPWRQANADLQRTGKAFRSAIRRRFVMSFTAEDNNVESRRAVTLFHRHGQMVETVNVQRRIGVNIFVAHGKPPKIGLA